MKTTKPIIQPGDFFRINSRRMSAAGEIVKVNRVTFDWRSTYFGHTVSGKIAMRELKRATISRPGVASFSIV